MNKIRTIGMIAILLMAMMSVVSAETLTLNLVTKDPATWDNTTNASAVLTYNTAGPTFDYSVFGTVPLASTQYALIYYADKPDRFVVWGGDNPGAVIGIGTSDSGKNINFAGSKDLSMSLPHPNDANFDTTKYDYCIEDGYVHCSGAKLWLVPTSDLTGDVSLPLDGWYPLNYLFETDLITYTDIDSVIGTASICEQPTIGISADPNNINFGHMYPEQSSSGQLVDIIVTETPQDQCSTVDVSVGVGIVLGAWNSPEMSTTFVPSYNPAIVIVGSTNPATYPVTFTAHAGQNIVPGTYTQTITFTATF